MTISCGWLLFLADADPPARIGLPLMEGVASPHAPDLVASLLIFALGLFLLLRMVAQWQHAGRLWPQGAEEECRPARARQGCRCRLSALLQAASSEAVPGQGARIGGGEEGEVSEDAIFEAANEGMFRAASTGRLLRANPALARLYGYPHPSRFLAALDRGRQRLFATAEAEQIWQRHRARQEALHDFEAEAARRDGSRFWVAFSAWPVPALSSGGPFYAGIIHDITERRAREESLRRACAQAEAANQAKSRFLANMSHELRTPLNAILGFSEMIAREMFGPLGSPRYREYARDIHDSGHHLLAIVNDILDLAKIEEGRFEIEEAEIDLAALAETALRLLQPHAENKGLRLGIERPGELPRLRGDARLLRQLLINLLSNAVKFSHHGGRVVVRLYCADRRLVMAVVDQGRGMRPEEIPYALDPFVQVGDPLLRRGGTGLGLPLAKSIARLHGAELLIDSAPQRGTTVSVLFPAERVLAPKSQDESG